MISFVRSTGKSERGGTCKQEGVRTSGLRPCQPFANPGSSGRFATSSASSRRELEAASPRALTRPSPAPRETVPVSTSSAFSAKSYAINHERQITNNLTPQLRAAVEQCALHAAPHPPRAAPRVAPATVDLAHVPPSTRSWPTPIGFQPLVNETHTGDPIFRVGSPGLLAHH